MLVKRNSKGQTSISKIKRNNRAYTNKAEIADQFNKHFVNVSQNLAKRIENCDGSPTQFIRSTPVASFVMNPFKTKILHRSEYTETNLLCFNISLFELRYSCLGLCQQNQIRLSTY
ncbi:unnamed protein product [Porites lobata]|uniref:Uncharacterized protein n=1 Tax=Porites lobata TaxID=104759 RepID=A0ABN8NPV5_9CNID|nr:unnamed protein product [Porites lobata]